MSFLLAFYFITTSKDHSCKFWDGDKYDLVMDFNDHNDAVWALCVSSLGDFFITAGNDLGLRAYLQTKEQVFVSLEEDARQEKAIVEKAFVDSQKYQNESAFDSENNQNLTAQQKNQKSILLEIRSHIF